MKTSPDGKEVWFSHKLSDAVSVRSTEGPFGLLDTVGLGEKARPNHLEFVENAKRHKITVMPVHQYLAEMVLEQHPPNMLVWGAGVAWLLLAGDGRRFRLLGLAFVATIALLLAQASKPYYVAGAFPVALAAGGCAWERWSERHGRRWARPVVLIALVATWAPLAPLAFARLVKQNKPAAAA